MGEIFFFRGAVLREQYWFAISPLVSRVLSTLIFAIFALEAG